LDPSKVFMPDKKTNKTKNEEETRRRKKNKQL
jgi:hypothetical protein